MRCNALICKNNNAGQCKHQDEITIDFMGIEANPTCMKFENEAVNESDVWKEIRIFSLKND